MSVTDLSRTYQDVWGFRPPRSCREMHAAGLFDPSSPRFLSLAAFDVYDAATLAKGDVYVAEELVPGLVPIGGDRSGDRWCFDTRLKVHGTTPILYCSHDGGGAEYVAPSFAGFVFRLIAFSFAVPHLFAQRKIDAAGIVTLTRKNAEHAKPWLLNRWAKLLATPPAHWPAYESFDAWLAQDPAFARLPRGPVDAFRG